MTIRKRCGYLFKEIKKLLSLSQKNRVKAQLVVHSKVPDMGSSFSIKTGHLDECANSLRHTQHRHQQRKHQYWERSYRTCKHSPSTRTWVGEYLTGKKATLISVITGESLLSLSLSRFLSLLFLFFSVVFSFFRALQFVPFLFRQILPSMHWENTSSYIFLFSDMREISSYFESKSRRPLLFSYFAWAFSL